MKKILLGQLNSNGDCLYATVIARQIKEIDYPNCHLTWAVNSRCKQTVLLNPYIDEIWEIPTDKTATTNEEWSDFVQAAEAKRENGEFDRIFLTQIIGSNWLSYDGGIRSSIYNSYPHKITVSPQPILNLSAAEIESVKKFAETHRLADYRRVVLVECAPGSFEAALNPQSAYRLAIELSREFSDAAFILSSNQRIESEHPNIIDGSQLTFRENTALTHHCNLLIGCASGISWLMTTNSAKKLDSVLVVVEDNPVLPSMIYDHEHLGLPTNHIIEIKNGDRALEKVENCVRQIWRKDFAVARKQFNETIKLTNYQYLSVQLPIAVSQKRLDKFFWSLRRSVKRNGFRLFFSRDFKLIVRTMGERAVRKLFKTLQKKTSIQN